MHRRTSPRPIPPILALMALALAACGDDDPTPAPIAVQATWVRAPADPAVAAILAVPTATPRYARTLSLCPARGTIDAATHDGAPVLLGSSDLASCRLVVSDALALTPGTQLVVTTRDGGHVLSSDATVPPLPDDAAHFATDMLAAADGTLWTATPHHGLVGLTADGGVARYPGIASAAPWDATATTPQSDFVLALASAGPRALWLGTATTGVSWFDPGPDPRESTDDTWRHGQPLATTDGLAAELAQTTIALAADPADPSGVWIASANGLHHGRLGADGIDVVRVADGVALAVAVAPDGRVWAGFSTQIAIADPDPNVLGEPTVPAAPGALLVLDPGADPHDPSDDVPTWAMEDEDAVTALLTTPAATWIGTPYALVRATLDDADQLTLTPQSAAGLGLGDDLAVVALAPSRVGLWLAARAECTADEGRLLRLDLDDAGAIAAVHDLSERGFGERDFNRVLELPDGRVAVSTLVPTLPPDFVAGGTARGCTPPPAVERTADLYRLDTFDGTATPW